MLIYKTAISGNTELSDYDNNSTCTIFGHFYLHFPYTYLAIRKAKGTIKKYIIQR